MLFYPPSVESSPNTEAGHNTGGSPLTLFVDIQCCGSPHCTGCSLTVFCHTVWSGDIWSVTRPQSLLISFFGSSRSPHHQHQTNISQPGKNCHAPHLQPLSNIELMIKRADFSQLDFFLFLYFDIRMLSFNFSTSYDFLLIRCGHRDNAGMTGNQTIQMTESSHWESLRMSKLDFDIHLPI